MIRFSTARTTPSLVLNPIAVDPSCNPITTQLQTQIPKFDVEKGQQGTKFTFYIISIYYSYTAYRYLNIIRESERDRGETPYLDGFNCIFNLKQTAFGRKSVDSTVILSPILFTQYQSIN